MGSWKQSNNTHTNGREKGADGQAGRQPDQKLRVGNLEGAVWHNKLRNGGKGVGLRINRVTDPRQDGGGAATRNLKPEDVVDMPALCVALAFYFLNFTSQSGEVNEELQCVGKTIYQILPQQHQADVLAALEELGFHTTSAEMLS